MSGVCGTKTERPQASSWYSSRGAGPRVRYRAKQGGQLASKMRFPRPTWYGMLGDGVWIEKPARERIRKSIVAKLSAVLGIEPAFP